MLEDLNLKNILFLDIETVPVTAGMESASPRLQQLWEQKSAPFRQADEPASEVWARAALYAEFGKIICISAGVFSNLAEPKRFRIKSFFGDDEKVVLESFSELLRKFRPPGKISLCAHNGKDFDFPYLARRMLAAGLDIPGVLQTAGKKPWEVNFLDTMELWKFGAYRNFTSLALLAEVLDLPDPKDDMDGSQVAAVYYQDGDMQRIARYCEKDVLSIAQILLRFRREALIPEENVEVVNG